VYNSRLVEIARLCMALDAELLHRDNLVLL